MRALLILSIVVTSVVGACSPAEIASILPAAGPLVTVTTRGGECPEGPCGQSIVLERDGRVHEAAKPPNDLGAVPAAQVAAIDAAIRATDFAGLRSHPFTGECPTAFDGQEVIFEFAAPSGIERIATCEVEVDFGMPLFVVLGTALGPFMALPVT